MNKVIFIETENMDGTITEHAIIDRGNGEFISMLKSTYEAEFLVKSKKTNTQSE